MITLSMWKFAIGDEIPDMRNISDCALLAMAITLCLAISIVTIGIDIIVSPIELFVLILYLHKNKKSILRKKDKKEK